MISHRLKEYSGTPLTNGVCAPRMPHSNERPSLGRFPLFRYRNDKRDRGCSVKSWEILRDAVERVGVKALAGKLNLSTALVYKWCQEPPKDDPAGSGARNPLDRIQAIIETTKDDHVVNWLCHEAGGFFVRNPAVKPSETESQLLGSTHRMVVDFGDLLAAISRSIEDDGEISVSEADHIRQAWETLKTQAECFVVACEQGLYRQMK